MSINEIIYKKIKYMPNGKIFIASDLDKDFNNKNAVEKALSRLTILHTIDRIDRGIYQKPKVIKPYNIKAVPSTKDILDAKSKLTGAHFAHTGASALYQLGITSQVPSKDIYLSDKRLGNIKIGNKTIYFKYVDYTKTQGGNARYNLIFNALDYLGKDEVINSTLDKLSINLNLQDINLLYKNMIHRKLWIQKACIEIIKKANYHLA